MGVIVLALVAADRLGAGAAVPLWVKVVCATAIAAGTFSGGWRVIRTLGTRVTELESPQGFSAETSSSATILASSYFGYPLSTTQVIAGGVTGTRPRRRGAARALERRAPDGRRLGAHASRRRAASAR